MDYGLIYTIHPGQSRPLDIFLFHFRAEFQEALFIRRQRVVLYQEHFEAIPLFSGAYLVHHIIN